MRPIEKRARRTDYEKKLNGDDDDDDVSFWHQMSRTRTVSEPFEMDSAVAVKPRLRMPSLNLNLNSVSGRALNAFMARYLSS